jgi:hypothetical protein
MLSILTSAGSRGIFKLNETLSADTAYETETSIYEDRVNVVETYASKTEIKDPSWGDGLTNYVMANQHELVRCPWMGGAEVTLGEAMTTYSYPPNMTEEDVPAVRAVVNELLANRVRENEEDKIGEVEEEAEPKEEPSEENSNAELEEKVPVKTNDVGQNRNAEPQAHKKPISPRAVNEEKPEPKFSEPQDLTDYKAGALSKAQSNNIAASELGNDARQLSHETPQVTPAKIASSTSESTAYAASPYNARGSKPATITSSTSENSAQKSEIGAQLARDNPETITGHEGPVNNSPGDAAGLIDEKFAQAEGGPTFTVLDQRIGTDELINFDEEEISPNSIKDDFDSDDRYSDLPGLEFLEDEVVVGEKAIILPKTENILGEPEQTENTNAEQPEQVDFDFGRAEDLLAVLSEYIESSEPEAAKAANELLYKINGVLAKLEADDVEDIINEAEFEEELEELFIELFDSLGINYTPKLAKSLALLTVKLHLADKIGKLKEEETDETSQDNGTHENIKKPLVGSNTIRNVMPQVCAIGKSALQLYRYDFPTELRKRLAAT